MRQWLWTAINSYTPKHHSSTVVSVEDYDDQKIKGVLVQFHLTVYPVGQVPKHQAHSAPISLSLGTHNWNIHTEPHADPWSEGYYATAGEVG